MKYRRKFSSNQISVINGAEFMGMRVDLVPFPLIDTPGGRDLVYSLMSHAKRVGDDVIEDFGEERIARYTKKFSKTLGRIIDLSKSPNGENLFVIGIAEARGDFIKRTPEYAIGIASINPCVPEPKHYDAAVLESLRLGTGADGHGNLLPAYFATYWFGPPQHNDSAEIRRETSLQIARVLTPHAVAVAGRVGKKACTLTSPEGVPDISAGMRETMSEIVVPATQWEEPSANHVKPYELRMAAE